MNASRGPLKPPDIGGVSDDWQKLRNLRRDSDKPPGDTADQELEELRADEDQEQRPGRRPSRPGRSRGGKRPPPAAADAIPTTVRFDPEEASEVDRFVLELRDDAARRNLDKAEVIRELLRMAREHEPTKKALLRRLR
ncbi:hypothetical protein ACWCQP_48810 [Streptomyces chartreusis]